jgi:hypothetical protein
MTNLRESIQLASDIQHKNTRTANGFYSQKLNSSKQQTVKNDQNLEMHLLPSTNKYYKRTFRHYFKRRMNQMERPLIIITFQGVLGDFIKEGGLSVKQDHLMSKQYLQSVAPSGPPALQ